VFPPECGGGVAGRLGREATAGMVEVSIVVVVVQGGSWAVVGDSFV